MGENILRVPSSIAEFMELRGELDSGVVHPKTLGVLIEALNSEIKSQTFLPIVAAIFKLAVSHPGLQLQNRTGLQVADNFVRVMFTGSLDKRIILFFSCRLYYFFQCSISNEKLISFLRKFDGMWPNLKQNIALLEENSEISAETNKVFDANFNSPIVQQYMNKCSLDRRGIDQMHETLLDSYLAGIIHDPTEFVAIISRFY